MRRRPRLRRVMKWAGTVTCLLLLAEPVLTTWIYADATYEWVSPKSSFNYAYSGRDVPWVISTVFLKMHPGWVDVGYCSFVLIEPSDPRPGLRCQYGRPLFSIGIGSLLPHFTDFFVGEGYRHCIIQLPLWMPLLVVLIPTLLLWYRDYRAWRVFRPAHCQACGYDLTGNESGRCPECGTHVPNKQQGSQRT
jgi:hypothetical protein